MKRFFTKAFDQGFIAVCAGICTSPMLIFAFFFNATLVIGIWVGLIVGVFLLGGVIDWCGSGETNDDYPNYSI